MSSKQVEQARNIVYDYIWRLARCERPETALNAFYDLLYRRIAVGEQEIVTNLDMVIEEAGFKQEKGLQFLNRAFYTLCNPWHLYFEMMPYLNQLIETLNHLPEPSAQDPLTRLLQRRLQDFNQSQYGDCLRRQMRLGIYSPKGQDYQGLVGDHLADYFYLYCSTTRTPDIEELEQMVYDDPLQSGLGFKQSQKLEEMYRAIGQYYYLRRRGETNLVNPTRLSVPEFERGLLDYHCKRPDGYSQRAEVLETQIFPTRQYGSCRSIIQDYLMAAIEFLPQSIREKFRRDFFRALSTVEDEATMAVSTQINLFTRLLNAVFLPAFNISNICSFQRNVDRSDPMSIVRVLLSLLLPCRMIRFDLEKKLGFLYRHFENTSIQAVPWVMEFFEHINLALVMNAKKIGYFSVAALPPDMESI
jgi:hypothetical protein